MYYAKQVNPEFAESFCFYHHNHELYFEDEFYGENVILCGNRDFMEYYPEELKNLKRNIEYFNSDLDYGDLTELANYYFKKANGKKWSKKELHQWKLIANETNEEIAFLGALRLVTGKVWKSISMRGYCQGEWQNGYVSETITHEDVDYIEMCYFGKGNEYIVYDCEEDFNENDNGVSYYVDSWKSKDRLCEQIGCEPKDLIVYNITGYSRIPQYEIEAD